MSFKRTGLTLTSCVITILAIALMAIAGAQPANAQGRYVPDEVLVGFKPSATLRGMPDAPSSIPGVGAMVGFQRQLNAGRVKLAPGVSINAAINKLRARADVLYAEPNMIRHALATPNDTSYGSQYGPQKIKADLAWDIWQPQQQVIVAIVDTGVQGTHADLTNVMLKNAGGTIIGHNSFTGTANANDDHGHGTHCAGITAAQINNGTGVAGVAGWNPNVANSTSFVKIMPVKVLDNTGNGTDATVADGITWATDNGAHVISMSLGDSGTTVTLQNAVQYAIDRGVVVVAAAGNSGVSQQFFPAAYPNVISVAATDRTDTLTSWSNWGSWVKIAAPGDGIYNTYPGGYATLSGTSMACPHVAGVAALMRAHYPTLSRVGVYNLIVNNTDPFVPYSGRFLNTGAGRLNAYLSLSAGSVTPAPPTGLTASGQASSILLSWNLSQRAATYNVKRATSAGGPYTNVATNVGVTNYTDISVVANTTYYYVVTAVNPAGESLSSNEATAALTTATATATFVKSDTTTKGNWKGAYGSQGYSISQLAQSLPSWATLSVTGHGNWIWANPTSDVRALQKTGTTTDRIAACWFSGTTVGSTFTFDLNITDGQQHQVAIYGLDWDAIGRVERVDVVDFASNAVLNSQTLSPFSGGTYLVWNIKGHVKINVVLTSGANAVLSGLFFDPVGGPPPSIPAAPANLTAVAGDTKVSLSWDASAGATSYNVKRSTTSGGPYTAIKTGATATTYDDTSVTNGTTYYYVVTAVNNAGESGNSNQASATPGASTATAVFVGSDGATKGNWQGIYGAQGYSIPQHAQSLPSYATLSTTGLGWTWAASTADVRGLKKPANPSDRIATCWYSPNGVGSSFTYDLNLTDGLQHQVSFYNLDWDNLSRAQKIEILDAGTNAVLDSQTVTAFSGGIYMSWNIKGHVKIKVTVNAGLNSVISGIFFDAVANTNTPPSAPTGLTASAGDAKVVLNWNGSAGATSYTVKRGTTAGGPYITTVATNVTGTTYTDTTVTNGTAYYYVVTASNANGESGNSNEASATPQSSTSSAVFVRSDTATKGNWKGVYGAQGYNIVQSGWSVPSYVQMSTTGQGWTWAGSTTDVRALQKAGSATDRIAACWYSPSGVGSSFTFDLNLTDGLTHQVALYGLDWDSLGRAEKVEFLDAATNTVLDTQTLSGFSGGAYLVWNVKGHVKIRVTVTGAANAVVSGVFFD